MELQEHEVTAKKLAELFTNAFIDVSDLKDDRLSVISSNFPFPFLILVDAERKSIRFTFYYFLNRISEHDAALICNEINRSVNLVRVYTAKDEERLIVISEYDMTFSKGIIPYQVMANFRIFEKVTEHIARNFLSSYLGS